MKQSSLVVSSLTLVLSLGAAACGSTAKNSGNGSAADKTSDGATGPCGVGKPTHFKGDENCLLPPPPDQGLQIHVGPTDYDNPDDIWVVQPGAEPTQNYHVYTSNTDNVYFFDQKYRMRPGSHHMIISTSNDTTSPAGWTTTEGSILGAIGGTQHQSEDFPPGGVEAPEDYGLAHSLDPHTALDIQLHFYNTTDEPVLREVWVNLMYKPKSQVTQPLGYLGGFAPINVPAHSTVTTGGTCDYANAVLASGATTERIVTLFGHAHSHTTRFVVYRDHADGTTDTVYDNYDWSEGPTYTYNSVVKNPVPKPSSKLAGAISGDLLLNPGDKLRYECDIQNDLDIALPFAERVDTGEMCNLFGTVASPGFPCFDLSKVPGGKKLLGKGDAGVDGG